jgi:hypothetical protein
MSAPDRRALVERGDRLSIRRQCVLLGVARSGLYRPPRPANDDDLGLMRRIDELFTAWPFLGSRRMAAMLRADGWPINRKRVQRLMRRMGIAALGPKPRTTKPASGHKIFPYLLRNMAIDRPNQVWAADITYVPIGRGFLYLVAVIDWASRQCWLGVCQTRWMCRSACRRSRRRWRASAGRRSSTPTRAASSRAPPSPVCSPPRASESRWMAAGGGWTTCSSSGCGVRSSTRTSISRATPTAARPRLGSVRGSPFTICGGRIRRSAIGPQ